MPTRTCIGCRVSGEQSSLVRFVAADGVVVVDAAPRATGRGAYLHHDPQCLSTALKRRAFPRALRSPVDASRLAEQLSWS